MTSSTATEAPTQQGIDLLTHGVDVLLDADLSTLSPAELVEAAQRLEVQKRRQAAVEHALVAEIDSRGVAAEYACRQTADLLAGALRIDAREATARVRAAAELGPRTALSGEPLSPIFERVAAAQAAGVISPAHARIITKTIDELPHEVAAEVDTQVEEFLVEQACQFDPRTLRLVARRMTDTLNPDGRGFDDADRERLRQFTLREQADGTCSGTYRTDAITGEALRTFFDAAAQPVSDESGMRDPRSPDQRRHDALRDLLLGTIRSGELPATGGVTTTIVLTMTPQQLMSASLDGTCDCDTVDRTRPQDFDALDHLVLTGHGSLISLDEALSLLGDAQIFPVLHGKTKKIEAYGDTHRIFTQSQRLAMMSRDLGCSFPGCTAPPAMCEAHHITDFCLTRRTTVDDGCLLCAYHHREFLKRGFRCEMIDGIPHWIAPTWIDPTQTPRRNLAHLPELPPIPSAT